MRNEQTVLRSVRNEVARKACEHCEGRGYVATKFERACEETLRISNRDVATPEEVVRAVLEIYGVKP